MAGTRSRVARCGAHIPQVRPAPVRPARRRALRGAAQEDEPANGLRSRARSRAGTAYAHKAPCPGSSGQEKGEPRPAKFPSEISDLVPRARFELARLTAPPPQDGVSTSSTTWAEAGSGFVAPLRRFFKATSSTEPLDSRAASACSAPG